jgi:hypothetical protein
MNRGDAAEGHSTEWRLFRMNDLFLSSIPLFRGAGRGRQPERCPDRPWTGLTADRDRKIPSVNGDEIYRSKPHLPRVTMPP